MPALFSDVLPWIYSRSNALQRMLSDAVSNPIGSAQQALGQMADNSRSTSNALAQAFQDPKDPFRVTDSSALNQATGNVLSAVLGAAPVGLTVYHGSPHTFDAFDASRVGTGEGAQSYGHGVYVAESPDVAKSYKSSTSYQDSVRQFRNELPDDAGFDEVMDAANGGHMSAKANRVVNALADNDWLGFDYPAQAITAAFKSLKNYDASPELHAAVQDYGNLYKADLPDGVVSKMLDWDNGGQAVWQQAVSKFGSPQAAATALRAQGIPGIRYLDGASRNSGQGTSNFVVFPGEEPSLTVLERNGQPVGQGN